jgi:DNA-binding NarL/FixJ family response regulator
VIRLVIVDDHPIVREGVTAALTADNGFHVVGDAATPPEAMQAVRDLDPDVVVLDLRLGAAGGGTDLCSALQRLSTRLRVIVLTSFPTESNMLAAFEAGAKGFLVKDSDIGMLRDAVRTVATGGTFIDPRVAAKLVNVATKGRRAKGPFGLTMQEMRVLAVLPRGLTNRDIGIELGVSEETVKSHLRRAMAKLKVHDRTQAAAVAIREGLT